MNRAGKIRPPDVKDCWKTIGVWGRRQPRCPVLAEVIHCRNCDVFKQAGRRLLDRDLPDTYRNEWAEVMAGHKEEQLFKTLSVLVFRIEEEWLALKTSVFAEVISPRNLKVHSLPHRKNRSLTGVINVRGEIQLCVSLKQLLGIEAGSGNRKDRSAAGYKRMLVMESDDGRWVFPVDEILGIHRVHPNAFQNVPVTVAKAQSTFTKGIFMMGETHVAYLDDELLVYSLARSVQ